MRSDVKIRELNRLLKRRLNSAIKRTVDHSVINDQKSISSRVLKACLKKAKNNAMFHSKNIQKELRWSTPMLEHYISCYFNKNLKSATVNFLNSSTENVYEPFKPYDWVLGKDGKYVWDEEVTSKYDTDLNGREYIGKTLKKVENHFIKNNSWFSRYTGSKKGGFLSYTDLNSYYTPRVNMVVQDVFNRHKWKHNLVKNKSNRLNNGRFDKTNVNNDFNILVKGSNQSIEGAVCLDGHEYSYNAVINTSAISSKQLYITDYFYTHNRKGSMLAIGNTGNDLLGNYFSVSNKFVHSDIPVISVHFDNIDEMKKVESWYLKYLGE